MSIAASMLECNPTVVKGQWAAVSGVAEEPFSIAVAGEICIAAGAADLSVVAAVGVAVVAGVVVAVAGDVKCGRGAKS